jgi:acyl-CoA thioesterase II
MVDPAVPIDLDAVIADTLEVLTVRPSGDGGWVGDAPDWFGEVLFGGFVIAQAIVAVTRDAPPGRRLNSLHAYFLRPVVAAQPISYRVHQLREGRTFTTRRLEAAQSGKATLDMTCSFAPDTDDGYLYDLPLRYDVPAPEACEEQGGPGPWVAGFVGATPPAPDGTREATHRMWFRVPAALPDDERLHEALLGFATDWTGTGGRPLHLDHDMRGMVSIDHAVWFHRPARADEWLFYEVSSLVNAGGRGLLRGTMRDRDLHVVISVAQEMRLTRLDGMS